LPKFFLFLPSVGTDLLDKPFAYPTAATN